MVNAPVETWCRPLMTQVSKFIIWFCLSTNMDCFQADSVSVWCTGVNSTCGGLLGTPNQSNQFYVVDAPAEMTTSGTDISHRDCDM